nr:monodehydroascorbate reductase [Tanacetum cinerariifolium]
CYLDLEKSQGNPIYKIAVDLLKNTNFFRAFTASSTIPSIYIQQFWDTIQYDKKAGSYMCQLDEQWFILTKDTLREALQITPINNNQPFVAPPSSDALINFVNELGYPKLVRNVSNILWSIIKRAHVNYAERIWEEFTQSIHTFIKDKQNLSRYTTGKKKATLIVIPSSRFTKLIIHHLQRMHRFYPRPDSPLHLPNEEHVLGYLKFSAKGTKREVFGMPIPGSLITADIQEASYYQEYLENVAKHRRYLAGETGSDQNSPTPKPTKPARKSKTTTPKAPPRTLAKKRSLKNVVELVAEDEPAKEPQVAAEDTDLQKALEESIKTAYVVVPRGSLSPVVIREPEAGKYQPLPEVPGKGKAKPDSEEESEKVVLGADEGDVGAQDEGQAGPNPDENSESQAGPDPGNVGDDVQSIPSLVVHAGSDREHMDLDVADVSPTQKKKKSRESPKTPPGSPPHQLPPPPPPAGPSGASGASGSSHVPPPPPPPSSTNQESPSKGSVAPSSSKTAVSAEYQAWTTTDIRLRPSISLTPADLEMDEDMAPDEQAQSSDDEDIGSAHIPKASALASNYSPPAEDSLLAQTGDIATFMDWFCKRRGITELKPQTWKALLLKSLKSFILIKPLPLRGPPGQVTIQSDFFFNKDLEYLRYGSKGSRPALSISKMKAAYYLDAGLEQMVPDQFWIKEECKYDIAAMYDISHWWFQRQRFYIDRHTFQGDRRAVMTHMRILSVVRIEVFSMYGPVPVKPSRSLEPPPTERQEDSYYGRQPMDQTSGYRKHVKDFQLGIESYQTQLNLTKPQWDATGFEYKHDYAVIDSSRAVMFRDKYEDESRFKYEVLDQKRRVLEQGVHVCHSESIEDKEDLSQHGELC